MPSFTYINDAENFRQSMTNLSNALGALLGAPARKREAARKEQAQELELQSKTQELEAQKLSMARLNAEMARLQQEREKAQKELERLAEDERLRKIVSSIRFEPGKTWTGEAQQDFQTAATIAQQVSDSYGDPALYGPVYNYLIGERMKYLAVNPSPTMQAEWRVPVGGAEVLLKSAAEGAWSPVLRWYENWLSATQPATKQPTTNPPPATGAPARPAGAESPAPAPGTSRLVPPQLPALPSMPVYGQGGELLGHWAVGPDGKLQFIGAKDAAQAAEVKKQVADVVSRLSAVDAARASLRRFREKFFEDLVQQKISDVARGAFGVFENKWYDTLWDNIRLAFGSDRAKQEQALQAMYDLLQSQVAAAIMGMQSSHGASSEGLLRAQKAAYPSVSAEPEVVAQWLSDMERYLMEQSAPLREYLAQSGLSVGGDSQPSNVEFVDTPAGRLPAVNSEDEARRLFETGVIAPGQYVALVVERAPDGTPVRWTYLRAQTKQ